MWRVCAALYIPGCLLALCTKISRTDATLDEVVEAAKAAHAHSLIERLPIGYDTVIGEEGSNFSQGQRQLPCIARVMLVLILDKATSSIDTRTELRVQKAFDSSLCIKNDKFKLQCTQRNCSRCGCPVPRGHPPCISH